MRGRPGAAALLLIGAGMAVLFPGTGTMPFRWVDAIPAALSFWPSGFSVLTGIVRWTAAVALLGLPLFLVDPGCGGCEHHPTGVGGRRADHRRVRARAPPRYRVGRGGNGDLADRRSGRTTSHGGRLVDASGVLPAPPGRTRPRAGPGRRDPPSGSASRWSTPPGHWGSAYLPTLSLARGWDRQADYAYNPIFYDAEALTAASYRAWLASLAVGWVALPTATLDYASVDEGQLIRGGLSYLRLTWSSPQWHLYRVVDSAPLVQGAQVVSVDSSGVVLSTDIGHHRARRAFGGRPI